MPICLIRLSAYSSSSSVVVPGRTFCRISSSNSRTTRPLRRSFSISAALLQIIMALQGDEESLTLPPPDPDRRLAIVAPLNKRTAILIAQLILVRRIEVNIVNRSAARAHPAARQPFHQQVWIDPDVER